MLGKIERRLALVILLTAIIPLAVAVVLANSMLSFASRFAQVSDVEQQLDRGVDLYKDYVRVVKDDMKHQADAIAADRALREGANSKSTDKTLRELDAVFPRYPELVSLAVEEADGNPVALRDRGRPVDDAQEKKLEVRRPLSADPAPPMLVATFAFDRHFEAELTHAGQVRDAYKTLDQERDALVFIPAYKTFAVLLAITAIVTVVLGFFLARGITRRISRLASAINLVAAGDLRVRVPVTGSDELTDLARVFNRMLGEMQQSRARIEFLQRIGAWQEMAQRLAHEIKNPLTPIQLAVQECHRKYEGGDTKYRALLDTTLEIVEEEVGTLRRLVGNFSSFARLPQAELHEASLGDFLRECSEKLVHLSRAADRGDSVDEEGGADAVDGEAIGTPDVEVRWEVPDAPLAAAIDRQMLRRVVVNLVRNSVQAIREARASGRVAQLGHVVVSGHGGPDGSSITVEDDGPGVPEEARERIFDPYFTTKVDGTGLGLAIVKKIVVEHNGSIEVTRSERLGGASFVVKLPSPSSLAIAAARAGADRPSGAEGAHVVLGR
jgi:nitrogen fixation/metabolism regulation signal transduction histidine kinase